MENRTMPSIFPQKIEKREMKHPRRSLIKPHLHNLTSSGFELNGVITPPSQVTMETLRKTYETNVFGAFSVLQTMLPLLRKSDAGRVVNMSSGLGSLTQNSDPNYEFANVKLADYNSSKATLNAFTVQFAYELKDTSIKVNSADPGFTATDLNGHRGTRTVEQAARIVVKLATLSESGPTGGFFDENGQVPW
ncbi:MAG: SDR family NAD(P)-dependent oxidoreductase [Desulfobacterium sp.]|nr:SDR family NAD(P)-dependent oxidoreductase [Desulfobacterium sp.]